MYTATEKLFGMNLIKRTRTIEQVPKQYRAGAIEYCYTQVIAGKITPEYFEEITHIPFETYVEKADADVTLGALLDTI